VFARVYGVLVAATDRRACIQSKALWSVPDQILWVQAFSFIFEMVVRLLGGVS